MTHCFKTIFCSISSSDSFWSGRSLSESIKNEAKCLLAKHGYEAPIKFRMVLLKKVKGFAAKMALLRQDKFTVVLRDLKFILLIRSSKKVKHEH